MNHCENLVKKAIERSLLNNPDITSGYSLANVSSSDRERVLWYILENYPDIAQDETLSAMILECAHRQGIRQNPLNSFLHFYFSYILAFDCPGASFDACSITEDCTAEMLEYILASYPIVWQDETLLQGIALFARTSPDNWWD